MIVDLTTLEPSQIYHLMTQAIVPRPIAWVLSDNGDDSVNLAPFSYFNAISSDPPLVMLSIGKKPNGERKDTRRNIAERSHSVIHIPKLEDLDAVSASAASLPHGESEVSLHNLPLTQESGWPLPRLQNASIAMLTRCYSIEEIGPQKQGLIFCEIEKVYIDPELASQDAKGRLVIDPNKMQVLSRLGANSYAGLGDVIKQSRPA
ncbi:MAG: protein/domain typically associated with flavoprotein oxygenase, DIM6/NTAB family protein [Alteromonadaceae bacterium]|nr:MAG: protein/domain typically associated with flavoprotein oxygenase, DIM6/NTAB family protein [Alteromonadaceae bacterium]